MDVSTIQSNHLAHITPSVTGFEALTRWEFRLKVIVGLDCLLLTPAH